MYIYIYIRREEGEEGGTDKHMYVTEDGDIKEGRKEEGGYQGRKHSKPNLLRYSLLVANIHLSYQIEGVRKEGR